VESQVKNQGFVMKMEESNKKYSEKNFNSQIAPNNLSFVLHEK